MIRIILCEGETDATLLGLYLENTCGWAYAKNPKLQIKLPQTNPITNEKSVTYSNGTEELISKNTSFISALIYLQVYSQYNLPRSFSALFRFRIRKAHQWT